MAKFHGQNSCLKRIETAVVPLYIVVILFRLSVVAQHAHFPSHFLAVGCRSTGFTTSPQILSRIKAECRGMTHRSSRTPAVFLLGKILGSVSLAGVFHNDQVIPTRDFKDWIHICGLSVQMHRNNRCDRSPEFAVIRFSGLAVQEAFSLDVFLKLAGVHAVSSLVHIDEVRPAAGLADTFRGCDERVGNRENYLARSYSRGH